MDRREFLATLPFTLGAAGFAVAAGWSYAHGGAEQRRALRPEAPASLAVPVTTVLAGRNDFEGEQNAPFTLIEFGDYQCPPCRAAQERVGRLLERYAGRLRLDFRHLPLTTIHPAALEAARTAEAARIHGRFWQAHRLLFSTDLTEQPPSVRVAMQLGLNPAVLHREMDRAAAKAVETDRQLANRLALDGTPTFLLCRPTGQVLRLGHLSDVDKLLA